MKKWVLTRKNADFYGIGKELGIDPVVVRIMRNRELLTAIDMEKFINGSDFDMHSPALLNDIDKASAYILQAISEGKKIRIIGDYDVDGVTSTCILLKGLRALNANVDFAIPNRITDGYGINEGLINEAFEDGVSLIVTCDNGIAARDALTLSKELGIDCIITDHHEVPYVENGDNKEYIYPEAIAIVNPKRHDSTYPFKGICGALVAFKLIENISLSKNLPKELLFELTELAGFGTVCDVMELRDENRVLVKKAMKLMNNSRNTGIKALMRVCELEGKPVSYHTLGFVLGPCINATGRLDDASLSLELLLCEDFDDAILKATRLRSLNEHRKELTEKGIKKAIWTIESKDISSQRVLVIYLPDVHESLAGIIAGRIREKYYRPVFVLTDGEDCIKGSGRSIESYDMYAEMTKISDVFIKYGGHKLAAGLSLESEKLGEFVRRINEVCLLSDEELIEKLRIDVDMPLSYVSEGLINDLDKLEPFGSGNPKPVFADTRLSLIAIRPMGKNGDMAKLTLSSKEGASYEFVMFRGFEKFKNEMQSLYGNDIFMRLQTAGILMDVVYYPSINEFRGKRSIQYILQDYRFKQL